jgi:Holliday junction resolvase
MSAYSRNKGRRGQLELGNLLRSRDWSVIEANAGTAQEDFVAFDPDGKAWCIEVKNTKAIEEAHRKQAMTQALRRKLPWLLASKITGTNSWLIQRQAEAPVVWSNHAQKVCA